MPIQIIGSGGGVMAVDGVTHQSVCTTLRPQDVQALGSYRMAWRSGTMQAGMVANSDILGLRWTDTHRLFCLTGFTLEGMSGTATAFADGRAVFQLFVARAMTADGSGGIQLHPTATSYMRKTMNSSLVWRSRIASTTAIGTGTRTLDAVPLGQCAASIGTTASTQWIRNADLFRAVPGENSPVVLMQNEGLVLQGTVPATGTWQFAISFSWFEVTSY